MDDIHSMPKKNKEAFIDGAMRVFGEMGYKKASVNDIAEAVGVSKAMVFYYFKNKRGLYQYLISVAGETVFSAFSQGFNRDITDFFDRIMMATELKLGLIKERPEILKFLASVYTETHPEVIDDIKLIHSQGESFRKGLALTDVDTSKFKSSVDPEMVLDLLVKYAEGYVSQQNLGENFDIEKMMAEFTACVNMLRTNLYKEEFL